VGLAAVITAMITDADKARRFSTHDKASRYQSLRFGGYWGHLKKRIF
jgi:hypothetical protein